VAIIDTIQTALPGSFFFSGNPVLFGTIWICLSVVFNFLVTSLIITRVLLVRREVKTLLRAAATSIPIQVPLEYPDVITMLVESAAPFTAIGIVFAITYAKNLDVAPAFTFIWGTFGVSGAVLHV
jgi:hypothetical protein